MVLYCARHSFGTCVLEKTGNLAAVMKVMGDSSPQTAMLYLPLSEFCNRFGPEGSRLLTSGVGLSPAEHPDSADGTMGRLQAVDLKAKKLAWVHHQPAPLSTSSVDMLAQNWRP